MTTEIFGIEEISASSSSKYLIHNIAIAKLEALCGGAVVSRIRATTPSIVNGQVYIVPDTGASGAWSGHNNEIAIAINGAWEYFAPNQKIKPLYDKEAEEFVIWDGTAWQPLTISGGGGAVELTEKGSLLSHNGTEEFELLAPVGLTNPVLTYDPLSADGIEWIELDNTLPVSVKGQLITHNGTETAILNVGANDSVLTADSTVATGITYKALPTSLLTTKGDLLTYSGSAFVKVSPGTNDYYLAADDTASSGLAWKPIPAGLTLPTSTKGDLLIHNGTDNIRLPIGANDSVLIADSSEASGARWGTVSISIPTTTKGDLVVHNGTTNIRLPVGTNDYYLAADSSAGSGLAWKALPSGASLPTTTKGDLLIHNGTDNIRLPIGANDSVLIADSGEASGAKWGTIDIPNKLSAEGQLLGHDGTDDYAIPAASANGKILASNSAATGGIEWIDLSTFSDPVTTKGDLYTYSTDSDRLAVGSNGQILSANSTQATGLQWVNPSPLTTKGDMYVYSTTNARLPIGTNGQVLVANSSEATGLQWQSLSVPRQTILVRTTGYIVTDADHGILIRCNNAITITLPSSGITDGFQVVVFNASSGSITFSGTGILSTGTTLNTQYTAAHVIKTGSNWLITGRLI